MAFLGMLSTLDFGPERRPESWRETILYLYPNGQMPLTGLTSLMPSEGVSDPTFHWWSKALPTQSGPITEIYTDGLLSAVYASGAGEGTTLYVNVSEATAGEFRPGHVALLRKLDDYRYDVRGKVVGVSRAGASSYVAVRLLHAPSGSYGIADTTHIKVIGNMNPEGATMPEGLVYAPTYQTNKTQIFRNPLSLTRTALRTRVKTGDQYKDAKREALEMHGIEMEKAFLWGKMYEGIGDNGKPERTTQGIITATIDHGVNVSSYSIDPEFTGKTWLQGGFDWMERRLEALFRTGSTERIALAGNGAVMALNRLARSMGQAQISSETSKWGFNIQRWVTPFGEIMLKTHPLFSQDPATRNDLFIFDPNNIRVRTIDDTFFIEDPMDKRNRNHSKDAKEEEFLAELGLEYHEIDSFGYLSGLGKDNP